MQLREGALVGRRAVGLNVKGPYDWARGIVDDERLAVICQDKSVGHGILLVDDG